MYIIGWIGSILLSICGIPQAWKCYKQGHGNGLSYAFIWTWFVGEIITAIYVYCEHGMDLPLLANYSMNIILILIILKYMYYPRSEA